MKMNIIEFLPVVIILNIKIIFWLEIFTKFKWKTKNKGYFVINKDGILVIGGEYIGLYFFGLLSRENKSKNSYTSVKWKFGKWLKNFYSSIW